MLWFRTVAVMGGEEERAGRDEGVAGGVIPRYSWPPPGSCGCVTSHSGRDSKCNHVRKQTTSPEKTLPQTQGFSFSLMFLETCKRGGSRRKLAKAVGSLQRKCKWLTRRAQGAQPLSHTRKASPHWRDTAVPLQDWQESSC